MTYIIPIIFGALFWLSTLPVPMLAKQHSATFDELALDYKLRYKKLGIAPLVTPWKTNLRAEQNSSKTYDEQEKFFVEMSTALKTVNPQNLNTCQRINYEILAYEIGINQQRLPIGRAYFQNAPIIFSDTGLSSVPQGQEWYNWYLHKWLTTEMEPDAIMAFGEDEIKKGLADLTVLTSDIITSGTAFSLAEFIKEKTTHYPNKETTLAAFKIRKSQVQHNLSSLFMPYDIAPLNIKANTNPAMARAPGYYTPPNFYYGWNGTSYRAQDTDFLYLHEGIPGHHFQFQIAAKYESCTFIMPQIFYSAFAEGWAAYVETLGGELGVYDSFETRLGAIDWNLIRSVRVYLDVAINYHGWSDKQAHNYWEEKLPPHLKNLAAREIKRMRDWPAQVITYKVGEHAILRLKASEQKRLGDAFNIRKFHDTLLRMGPVPLSLLNESYTALSKAP